MLIICSIFLTVNAGGIPVISKTDVEGKILQESTEKYLVDFSKGVIKYDLVGKPEDYKKVLVDKQECVKGEQVMSLVKILREMEENRPNAEMIINQENPATYGARIGLKRAAVETLRRLRLDYRKELLESTIFIVTTGTAKDSFAELASNDTFGCFSSDPEEFYKDIASRIDPTLYHRESIRHLYNIAGNILEDKCLELDIVSFNMLMFSEKYNIAVSNAEEFAASLKRSINDQVGSEIVGVNAVNSIADSAIKKNHTAKVTPLVLATSDEKFALSLVNDLKNQLKRPTFLVLAGKVSKELRDHKEALLVKNVSEESVGEALTSIRNKVL